MQPADLPAQWWSCDLAEAGSAVRLLRDVRPCAIVHLAGRVTGLPDRELVFPMLRDNLIATVNLLDAATANDCPRVVLAGTMVEATDHGDQRLPASPYAAAKTASAHYAAMFQEVYGLPVVRLRLFMVYGEGQADSRKLVPYVTRCLLRGEAPRLASGTLPLDWLYVGDVAEAVLAALCVEEAPSERVDVGSGRLLTNRAVVAELARIVGKGPEAEFGAIDDRPLVEPQIAQVDRTAELIGWRASTYLHDGLRRTVAWHARLLEREQGARASGSDDAQAESRLG